MCFTDVINELFNFTSPRQWIYWLYDTLWAQNKIISILIETQANESCIDVAKGVQVKYDRKPNGSKMALKICRPLHPGFNSFPQHLLLPIFSTDDSKTADNDKNTADIVQLNQANQTLQQQIQQLESSNQALNQDNEKLQQKVQQLQQRNDEMELKNAKLHKKLNRKEDEIIKLEEENESTMDELYQVKGNMIKLNPNIIN